MVECSVSQLELDRRRNLALLLGLVTNLRYLLHRIGSPIEWRT